MKRIPFDTYRDKISDTCEKYTDGLDTQRIIDAIHEKASGDSESPIIEMAKNEEFILKNARISANPYEVFTHCFDARESAQFIRDERHGKNMIPLRPHTPRIYIDGSSCLAYTAGPDFGHTACYWDDVLSLGFVGLLDRARKYAENYAENDVEAHDFIRSLEIVYDGIFAYLDRITSLYEKVSDKEIDGFVRENSREIADTVRALSKRAPETLREAMQMVFLYYNVQQKAEAATLRTLGPLDALLYPYMLSDMEKGILNEDGVRELVDAFLLTCYSEKVEANLPFALAGVDKNGNSRANRMSYIILEEYIKLNIHDPKIHFCYSKDTPSDLVRLALESVRLGRNSIVFINCDVASDALTALGEDREDTLDFTIVGCYEIAAYGKEIPCSCNARINLAKALEVTLFAGNDGIGGKTVGINVGETADFSTFDSIFNAYLSQCDFFSDTVMDMVRNYESVYNIDMASPALSSTFESCVERGRDAYNSSGAKYNNSSINAFGLATAADSLIAIKTLVFDEKRLTLAELCDILKANWEGHEDLRRYVLGSIPKYGNNDISVDGIAAEIVAHLGKKINGKPNGRGGRFRLGTFSIDWRLGFGEKTLASADGRLTGDPLSKNMCATTVRDLKGVTAHILSACAIDYVNIPNGTALDLTLHASAVSGDDGLSAFEALLKTFMIKRGFAVQFNVLSPETLRKAQKEPEKYKTLQVRLCGWNVRFCDLSKYEQDEYILQCEKSGGI